MNLKHYRRLTQYFSALAILIVLLGISGIMHPQASIPVMADSTAQKEALKSQYEQRKQEINQNISSIAAKQQTIDVEATNHQDQINALGAKSNQLNNEISARQKDIDNVQIQIVTTLAVITQIDSQVSSNEAQLEVIQGQVKDLLIEMQKQDRVTPLQTILASKSISEMLTKIFNLGTIQEQANELTKKIEDTQVELATNKLMQRDIQGQLVATQALFKSKQDNLQQLLTQTQGEQSKYEELLKEQQQQLKQLQDQQNQVKTQLDKVGIQYHQEVAQVEAVERARLDAINAQARAQFGAIGNGNISNLGSSRVGFLGCGFEADQLQVPNGYFVQPTTGYLTQGFSCFHDGLDIASGVGTPIYSVAEGKVIKKTASVGPSCWGFGCNAGYGNAVWIQYNLPSGQTTTGVYMHMNTTAIVEVGDSVKRGQQIGVVGNTGNSYGSHLHFSLMQGGAGSSATNGCNSMYGGSGRCYNPIRYIG